MKQRIPFLQSSLFGLSFILTLGASSDAEGKLQVVASTTTMRELVKLVCADRCEVDAIAKGPQDPHFVEAKPSYMVKARAADLIVAAGLDLEDGWLPNVIRGSRNPSIQQGRPGYFEAGAAVDAIEVPHGKIDRSQGDVHPAGNPHFQLDPLRFATAAEALATRLSQIAPEGKDVYTSKARDLSAKLQRKHSEWSARIQASKVTGVITYHRTLNYFLARYKLKLVKSIEPKPGIPPSARHIIDLLTTIRETNTRCVLVESFFETDAVNRLQKSVSLRNRVVPTEVEATPSATGYFELIESLVSAVEYCGEGERK